MIKQTENGKIRLSVVDGHPVIFWGIKWAIKKCKSFPIEFVNQYCCANEIIQDLDNLNCNVLLIDLCLPDKKGYDLAKEVLAVHPEVKIGMYSNMPCSTEILNSFENGALGYLLKSASSKELIDFIETISKGERYLKGQIADIVFQTTHLCEKCENESNINVTKRELEIIQLISEGYKNKEIADKLSISGRTVEFHKQNIYLKLEVNNNIDLVKRSIHHNIISIEDVLK